jgi:hypothetical protein
MPIDLSDLLETKFAVAATKVSGAESRSVCRRWLEHFCPNVKRNTGRWVFNGYWWHAYSFKHESALNGNVAFEKYQAQPIEPFYIYRQTKDTLFNCSALAWPDLRLLEDDLYVFPHTMEWSFLTTHEISLDLGPYFALPPN